MIPAEFVALALLLNCVGAGTYLYELLRGRIRPHIVTWSLWALAPCVAFFAQLSEGVGVQSLTTLFAGASPLLVVVILLVRRDASWAVTRFDLVCGALSVAGVVVWVLARRAEYAVVFAVLADAFASVPTYRKTLRAPGSESWANFGCLTLSALITLATLTTWSLSHYAFAAYLALLGASMTGVILVGRRRGVAGRRG